MNSVRSLSADQQGDHDPGDFAPEEDESWRELPPRAIGLQERRLQVRAYNCWAGMLGERQFPKIAGLTAQVLAQFGANAVLLDFTRGGEDPAIGHIGASLAEECGHADPITLLSEVPAGSLLSRVAGEYQRVLASRAPTGFEAEFVNCRGAAILYRGILLPFSSDDATIDHVLCVINWKELADAQVAHELQMQIGRTLEPRASPANLPFVRPVFDRARREPAIPADWADGPERRAGCAGATPGRLPLPDLAMEAAIPSSPVPDGILGLDQALVQRLRALDGKAIASLAAPAGEFTLLMVRMLPDGEIAVLGEVSDDPPLLSRAAHRLLDALPD